MEKKLVARPVKFETKVDYDAAGTKTTSEYANGVWLGYSKAVGQEEYDRAGFVYITGIGFCTLKLERVSDMPDWCYLADGRTAILLPNNT
jgi:hypothetical protein